ncbi:microviridin/marinostatin family tricyclic proteinase inhibitor [Chryseobacterium oryctis]
MKNKNSKKKPFFASFLEKQIKDSATVTGGSTTLPLKDTVTIPEYDSVTRPTLDLEHTQKYPSDGDDDVKYAE